MHSQSALILGGARSGKSSFGEKLALATELTPIYIATAEAHDNEMQERIAHHQQLREASGWKTIEEPTNIVDVISAEAHENTVIFIDCLTLWLSNITFAKQDIDAQITALITSIKKAPCPVICISNEVGMGIVPANKLARDFCDEAGRLNQRLAAALPNCYFIIAGLPMPLKKDGRTMLESLPSDQP